MRKLYAIKNLFKHKNTNISHMLIHTKFIRFKFQYAYYHIRVTVIYTKSVLRKLPSCGLVNAGYLM